MSAVDSAAAPPPSRARLHFHVALALIFVPCLGALVTLRLGDHNAARENPSAEHRAWTRRLRLLGLLDLAIVLFLVLAGKLAPERSPVESRSSQPSLGVEFELSGADGELRVGHVAPRWPAERAGIRVGDRILAVDEAPVATPSEFGRALAGGAPATRRVLTVRRGESMLTMEVAPLHLRKLGLFEPFPWDPPWGIALEDVLEWVPVLVLVGVACLWGRRKEPGGWKVGLGFLLALGLSYGGAFGAAVLMYRFQGGYSKGTVLVSMAAQVAGLLAGAAAASRWVPRAAPVAPDGGFLSWWKTALLGVLYLVTGMVRLVVVLFVADRYLLGGTGLGATNPIEDFLKVGLGTAGILLLLADVVLAGPMAEEALFRGYLQPRLERQLGARWGIVVSVLAFALMHPHYRLFMVTVAYYGLVLAWARRKSGGVGAPIALHCAINLIASLHVLVSWREFTS